jgi:OOP family OmpA-OmpF porin
MKLATVGAARPLTYCLGVAALSSLSLVRVANAQVAALAAEASLVAGTSEPALFEGQVQAPALSQSDPVSADEGGSDDFLHRYRPEANLLEVGAFAGPLFISDQNSFRGPTVVNPGRPPTVKPVTTFKQPSLELGVRGGYYPLAFLGGELEGMVAVAEGNTGDGASVLAARAHVVLQSSFWSVVPFVLGGVGYWNVRNDVSGNDADPAFHYGGGAKLNVTDSLTVRVDVRDTITNQRGDSSYPHNIEALAGANLVFGRAPKAPKDADGDGVLDGRDQCRLEPGAAPDGCPARDSDADGFLDPVDQCVQEAGIAPTGCPVRDGDRDGVLDGQDQCVQEPGAAPTGCPDGDQDGILDRVDRCPALAGVSPDGCLADADGDGLSGSDDHCPDRAETKNGFEDADGCPDELPDSVKNFAGVIAGIEFDNAQASIRPSSSSALEQAAKVLREYPSLRVQVIGHTDNRGSRDYNVTLSQQRAEAVKADLVARGIDASRIEPRGEGPDVPLTTNDSAAGRQKNRRIEFRVLQ